MNPPIQGSWQDRFDKLAYLDGNYFLKDKSLPIIKNHLLRSSHYAAIEEAPLEYPESNFELDPQKVKSFITQVEMEAEERGRKEMLKLWQDFLRSNGTVSRGFYFTDEQYIEFLNSLTPKPE